MCEHCGFLDAIDLADEMLFDIDYEFAEETIKGIKSWIQEHEHVTEAQKEALENIYQSKENYYDETSF